MKKKTCGLCLPEVFPNQSMKDTEGVGVGWGAGEEKEQSPGTVCGDAVCDFPPGCLV